MQPVTYQTLMNRQGCARTDKWEERRQEGLREALPGLLWCDYRPLFQSTSLPPGVERRRPPVLLGRGSSLQPWTTLGTAPGCFRSISWYKMPFPSEDTPWYGPVQFGPSFFLCAVGSFIHNYIAALIRFELGLSAVVVFTFLSLLLVICTNIVATSSLFTSIVP